MVSHFGEQFKNIGVINERIYWMNQMPQTTEKIRKQV